MLVVGVVPVALNAALDGIGVKFSVQLRQRNDFVAAGFDRACLVCADMAGLGGNYALIRAKDGPYHSGVGLRSADKKIDVSIGGITGFPYLSAGGFREFIGSVAGSVEEICLHKPLQDQRVSAFHVVGGEEKFGGLLGLKTITVLCFL